MKDPKWLIKARECGDVCPFDLTKPMKTRDGCRVTNLSFVPRNCVGNFVTFPIKGTVIVNEKPLKQMFMTWDLFGSAGRPSTSKDLVV